ncbi:MAG: SDR family NAD(P)-dependent oxidoreductase [Burkholderiaceae bacterium]
MAVVNANANAYAYANPKAKHALVIGARGGIGAATLARLDAQGWRTTALDQALALAAPAAVADAIAIDLANPASIAQAFSEVGRRVSLHGPIDLLALCSGIVDTEKVASVSLAHWNTMLATNLTGPFLCCQHSYPLLRDGARIVLIGSLAGRTGGVLTGAAYAATKGGIESLAKSMAQELAPRRITVNVVAPGAIDTPMLRAHSAERKKGMAGATPLQRLGRPEEVASAILYLASADAGFITGSVMHVNGGIRMD